jgi:hypothetical protein
MKALDGGANSSYLYNYPAIANLAFINYTSTKTTFTSGYFSAKHDVVLSTLRPVGKEDTPPLDVSGLWADADGGHIYIEVLTCRFILIHMCRYISLYRHEYTHIYI